MTIAEALRDAASRLRAAGIDGAMRDARRLMAHALGVETNRLTLLVPDPLSPEDQDRYDTLIDKRAAHCPVSQIVGGRWFRARWFRVTPATLDPRPETEILIDVALSAPFSRVLDLGTGTGAIAITLLAERADATGVATDISPDAILVAGDNAARLGVADRLVLPVSDWWDDVGGTYDLIVSNPPYIALSEIEDLAPDVRDWEPHLALTDAADGLTAYKKITAGVLDHLTPGGRLIVEIGPTQASAVTAMFQAAGLGDIGVHKDLDGRDRVVSGVRHSAENS